MLTSLFKKWGVPLLVLGAITAAPSVPKEIEPIMMFQDVASHFTENVDIVIPASTSTPERTVEKYAYHPKTFKDEDGNGLNSVALYPKNDGGIEVVQIPDETYLRATGAGGAKSNPKKTEFVSLLDTFTQKAEAAIAFDTNSTGVRTTATSLTWSHTMSATANGMLATYCWVNGASDVFTSLTYNGTTMSSIGSVASYNGAGNHGYMYYLVAPSTGANNIVLSISASRLIACSASSFVGVKQTGIPDASYINAGDGSSNNFSMTMTTVADNAWLVGGNTNLDGVCVAGSNTNLRDDDNPDMSDAGPITPAGSASLNLASCGNRVEDKIAFSFAPVAAAAAVAPVPDLIFIIDE